MNLQEKIDENTTLYYVESHDTHYDEDDVEITDSYLLSFGFYNCHYELIVTNKELKDDSPGFLKLQGESILFDSFGSHLEENHWELIRKKCAQFDEWKKELEKG